MLYSANFFSNLYDQTREYCSLTSKYCRQLLIMSTLLVLNNFIIKRTIICIRTFYMHFSSSSIWHQNGMAQDCQSWSRGVDATDLCCLRDLMMMQYDSYTVSDARKRRFCVIHESPAWPLFHENLTTKYSSSLLL